MMKLRMIAAILCCLLLVGLLGGAGVARAERESVKQANDPENPQAWLITKEDLKNPIPPPEGEVEGACGLAISPLSGGLYVSDYYHRVVDVFTPSGTYANIQIALAKKNPVFGVNALDAVCGLAFGPAGQLYANELHERVLLLPSEAVIDANESSGVAVDGAGDVYVDDRTYVAVYEAPVAPGDEPAEKIGLGSLGNGYGVAVDPQGKRVYVADAADNTVKVYEPLVKLADPVTTIDGPSGSGFNSLADAALAVDGSTGEGQGHLLVADNLKPGSEDPEVGIYEFDASGDLLDRLPGRTYGPFGEEHRGPIFGEPSGMTVDPASGDLYVTTGNSEKANVLKYGPYEPFAPPASATPSSAPLDPAVASSRAAGTEAAAGSSAPPRRRGGSEAVVVRRGPVQVSFDGKLTPHRLPRHGMAPVGIAVDTRITGTEGHSPPQLRRIAIAINRNGQLSAKGLPVCSEHEIQPSTTAGARAACGDALVGEGHFAANVKLPEQSPFPSSGKVLAFNGRLRGKPVILAHIYGTQPAPTSYVLPFAIRDSHGTYGTVLEASLPQATGDWGYVTGLKMNLRRSFRYRGKKRSYLSAGCPAPAGFPGAVFPLARTSFAFAGGTTLVSVLNRSCTAKG